MKKTKRWDDLQSFTKDSDSSDDNNLDKKNPFNLNEFARTALGSLQGNSLSSINQNTSSNQEDQNNQNYQSGSNNYTSKKKKNELFYLGEKNKKNIKIKKKKAQFSFV